MKKYYSEMANEIPEDFHNYRKNLNFNDPRLKEYYGYLNFIEDFLRTKSIERCMEKENTNSECFQLHAIDNIQYRMNLADSLINNREIKNIFINRLAIQGMIFSNEAQKINSVLELLKTIDFQSKNLSELEELARIQKNLLPGNNIGDLELINFKDEVVRLKEISTKPIITYHWSMEAPEHYRWQHELIKTLGNKYPEIEFVGINIDKNATEAWKNTLNAQGFASNNEYKLYNPSINMRLLKNHLNKLIFLDTNGQIINGAAQLNTPGFERQILEFLNN